MEKQYLDDFNKWHNKREVDFETNTPWHNFVSEEIEKLDLTAKNILEIGCGRGGFAINFAGKYSGKYSRYVAADFSQNAIEKGKKYAAQLGIKNIEWHVDDILKISFPDASFDMVISCETIEHVTGPKRAIKELYRVTKPGGLLILTTPNYQNFMGLYRIYLRLTGRRFTEVGQPLNKFVMFDKTIWWLKNAGFEIIHSDSSNILYPSFIKKTTITLDWRFPRFLTKRMGINSFFIAKKQ